MIGVTRDIIFRFLLLLVQDWLYYHFRSQAEGAWAEMYSSIFCIETARQTSKLRHTPQNCLINSGIALLFILFFYIEHDEPPS